MSTARIGSTIGFIVAVSLFLAAAPAQAAGFGGYFEYSRGIGYLDIFGFDADFDDDKYGVGFAFDTNVSRDRLFNYRLNVGYERTNRKYEGGLKEKLNGFSINNMFGFGVYRDPNARVWLGPSVRLGVDVLSDPSAWYPPSVDEVVDVNVGGGLALGVNVHTGDVGSAAFTFGYQYLYVREILSGGPNTTFDGGEHRISFNFSYFFRSKGDRYE